MRLRANILFSLFACLLWLGSPKPVWAQNATSKLIAQMSRQMNFALDGIPKTPGQHDVGLYNGKMVTACVDQNGEVSHLGYKLFPPEIKTIYPSDVYNFLERYLLEMSLIKDLDEYEQKRKDDRVQVLEGSLYDFRKITPEMEFSINRMEDKLYNVVWSQDGAEVLSLAFPIQYELLLGMPKVEIEKRLQRYINASSQYAMPAFVRPSTEPIGNGMCKSTPMDYYETSSLTNTSYFEIQADSVLRPVFSKENREYAAANLFLTDIAMERDHRLYVEQNLYGGEKQTYTVSLSDWLRYCHQHKMTVYFAIEEIADDGIKAVIVARCADLGYNHLLSVVIPDSFVDNPRAVIKAKVNAFIPTQNVKSLYGQYKPKPKKKI